MKIMIHSNAPWVPTGYGIQTHNTLRQLVELGHEVAVSAFYGHSGAPIQWPHPDLEIFQVTADGTHTRNITIYPSGKADYGLDVMLANAEHWGAELLITLMDTWKLAPIAHQIGRQTQETGLRLALWTPVDCAPLGTPDRRVLEATGALPLAMSRHGYEMMLGAGLDPRYVPHSVDTQVFCPPVDRDAHRAALGLDGKMVIGLNAANRDRLRKGFPEQFEALRLIRQAHPEVVMMLHTDPVDRGGMNLWELAEDHRVADAIVWSDTYAQTAGHLDQATMATWYQALDLLTNCSYAEGFGVPIVEAQACGVPVVATNAAAMSELVPWTGAVEGDLFWNPIHRAAWRRPTAHDIATAWEAQLFGVMDIAGNRVAARSRAELYAVDRVRDEYWAPVLAEVEKHG